MIAVISCMLVIAVMIWVFGKYLIRLFISEPDAVAFGEQYLKWIAFFYPFIGINFVLNGIVRVLGSDAAGSGIKFNLVLGVEISFHSSIFSLAWTKGNRAWNRNEFFI